MISCASLYPRFASAQTPTSAMVMLSSRIEPKETNMKMQHFLSLLIAMRSEHIINGGATAAIGS